MVPGQVITQETIDFMRKLDVKEIHGYDAAEGLKLVRADALAKRAEFGAETRRVNVFAMKVAIGRRGIVSHEQVTS